MFWLFGFRVDRLSRLTTQAQRLRTRGLDVIEQSKRATRSPLQRMVTPSLPGSDARPGRGRSAGKRKEFPGTSCPTSQNMLHSPRESATFGK